MILMKSFSRAAVLVFAGIVVMSVLSGCAKDESVTVKSYNNGIVEIQKGMFAKAQEISKVFEQPNQDPSHIILTLRDIQSNITSSHYQFRGMKVPQGAEQLAAAMENFFQIELTGMQDIIAAVEQMEGKDADPAARKNFTDIYGRFSAQENQALKDFYATQQQVADKYGQKVVQTD